MREAKNLLSLTQTETPLKGGDNTPLHATSFEGIEPKRAVVQTPNSIMVRRLCAALRAPRPSPRMLTWE